MTEIKTEKRNLRYDFTAVEIHDLSLQLAGKTKEKQAVEEEKSSVASQYSAKLKELNATCNKLSNQVSDGWELREIECTVQYHRPEQGKKTITRTDNNQKVVEKMEAWEWDLFNQPDEPLDDEPHTEDTSAEVIPNEQTNLPAPKGKGRKKEK